MNGDTFRRIIKIITIFYLIIQSFFINNRFSPHIEIFCIFLGVLAIHDGIKKGYKNLKKDSYEINDDNYTIIFAMCYLFSIALFITAIYIDGSDFITLTGFIISFFIYLIFGDFLEKHHIYV